MIRETSVEAYHKIEAEGLLSKRRFQVYQALYQMGKPSTGGEVFKHFHLTNKMGAALNSNVITRLGELRDMGCVEEIGTRKCSVSGQEVIVWKLTDRLPKPLARYEKRNKCEHCGGSGYERQNKNQVS